MHSEFWSLGPNDKDKSKEGLPALVLPGRNEYWT